MELKEQLTPYMGEVRVKVRLTNGADEILARQGKLEPAKVRSVVTDAMLDTIPLGSRAKVLRDDAA